MVIEAGLESVESASLRGVDPRGWKAARADRAIESVRRIQEAGVSVNGCFVLGLDGDDEGTCERSRDFVRDSGMQVAKIETLEQNAVGQSLYTSLGFREVARQIHYAMRLDG